MDVLITSLQGQGAATSAVKLVARLEDSCVLPVVGADAYNMRRPGTLATALELYHVTSRFDCTCVLYVQIAYIMQYTALDGSCLCISHPYQRGARVVLHAASTSNTHESMSDLQVAWSFLYAAEPATITQHLTTAEYSPGHNYTKMWYLLITSLHQGNFTWTHDSMCLAPVQIQRCISSNNVALQGQVANRSMAGG